jgi:hypothetical protein
LARRIDHEGTGLGLIQPEGNLDGSIERAAVDILLLADQDLAGWTGAGADVPAIRRPAAPASKCAGAIFAAMYGERNRAASLLMLTPESVGVPEIVASAVAAGLELAVLLAVSRVLRPDEPRAPILGPPPLQVFP